MNLVAEETVPFANQKKRRRRSAAQKKKSVSLGTVQDLTVRVCWEGRLRHGDRGYTLSYDQRDDKHG